VHGTGSGAHHGRAGRRNDGEHAKSARHAPARSGLETGAVLCVRTPIARRIARWGRLKFGEPWGRKLVASSGAGFWRCAAEHP